MSPSPVAFGTTTSGQHSAGYSATVQFTVNVADGGKADPWTVVMFMDTPPALPDTLEFYNADAGYQAWSPVGETFFNNVTVDSGSGPGSAVIDLRFQLGDAAPGSYSVTMNVCVNDGSVCAFDVVTVTITVSSFTAPTFTISTTNVSLGTSGTSDFQSGASALGTVTATIDDGSSVGTTLHVGVWDPYASPIAATMQGRADAGTWVSLEPRGAYATSKACTTSCTQTWDFRKLLSWTGDPPGGPYTSQLRFELRKTSDGSVLATQNADIDLTVASALSISLDMTTIPFGTVGNAGTYQHVEGMGVYAKSNVNHDLYIRSSYPTFLSSSGNNNSALSIDRLEWQNGDLMNGWIAVSGFGSQIYTGIAPYDGAAATVFLLYRVSIAATDPKDTYTAYLVLEVVAS